MELKPVSMTLHLCQSIQRPAVSHGHRPSWVATYAHCCFECVQHLPSSPNICALSAPVHRFEGSAALMQARGRPLLVQVIVMSDVVFFLQESNQKYHFVSQEGKVRAGGDASLRAQTAVGGGWTGEVYSAVTRRSV